MNTEDKPKSELSDKAKKDYKAIQYLYKKVNSANKMQRNQRCICGSGKKWKGCCIVAHEIETILLEKLIKEYRDICRQINRRSV